MLAQGKRTFCRRWWTWVALWTLLVLLVLVGLVLHEWPDGRQPLFDTDLPLAPGDCLQEPIVLARDGLYRLDVALTRRGPVTGHVVLCLTSDPQGREEIASTTVPADEAEDVSQALRRPYGYVAFRFSPVHSLHADRVWLRLESQADAPLGVRALEVPGVGSRVAMKTYCTRSPGRNLALFLTRLTDRSVPLLNCVWSYGILLAVYASLLVSLCWHIACASAEGGQDRSGAIECPPESPHSAIAPPVGPETQSGECDT